MTSQRKHKLSNFYRQSLSNQRRSYPNGHNVRMRLATGRSPSQATAEYPHYQSDLEAPRATHVSHWCAKT